MFAAIVAIAVASGKQECSPHVAAAAHFIKADE